MRRLSPYSFLTCENHTKNEKNQINPELRSSKPTVTPWRLFRIRVRKTYPSLKGGASLGRAASKRNSIARCLFWLQYLKISCERRFETPSNSATSASNFPVALISSIDVPAKLSRARNTRSLALDLPSFFRC